MRSIQGFLDYQLWSLRATWPPLLLAGLCVLLALVTGHPVVFGLAGLGMLVLFFDSAARLRDFERVRVLIRRSGGLTGAALRNFRKARVSWCTRRSAIAAAYAEGLGEEARRLVRHWGYRPWHVFPDGAFTRNSPFLRVAFWKSVLGFGAK